MKKLVGLLAVIFLVFESFSLSAQEEEKVYFINNVTILTLNEGEFIEDATVSIIQGRIVRIIGTKVSLVNGERLTEKFDSSNEIKEDETRTVGLCCTARALGEVNIDGTGKYLIPGLAEMHGHIPNATSYNQNLKDLLFLYLSSGVTTVRGMLGNSGQLKLQQDILDGEILGPTLYLGSPSFRGSSVTSPLQARKKVRDHVAEGWDFLKIHPGLTLAEYNAMADEATKQGITWGGHVPEAVGLWRALEAGQVTIDHIDGYEEFTGTTKGGQIQPPDETLLEEAIQVTLESGAGVVPTNALWETLLGGLTLDELEAREEMKYATRAERRSWRNRHQANAPSTEAKIVIDQTIKNRRAILKALYEGGVPILLGSDAPQLFSVPGFSIPREMENMSEAGIDNLGILQAGTVNVGEFFKDKDAFGRIAEGQRADLILLNANPLEDISNIRDIAGVMVRGIWISREEIDTRLAEIAERNK